MAKKPIPTPDELRQLLRYEPETGRLFWRARPDDDPTTLRRIIRNWNTRFAGKEAFLTVSKRGYHTATIHNRHAAAHRVAWAMCHGEWPKGHIDHIDGNPLNNRIENLRVVGDQENRMNVRPYAGQIRKNQTGCVGVWWDKKRNAFQAYITQDRKRIGLGRYATLDEARLARKQAEKEIGFHPNHGDFSRLQYVQSGPAPEAPTRPDYET